MSNDTVENSGEFTRPITVRLNEDGTQSAESVLTPTQMTTRAECMLTSRLVIPVIFLPGIMGTRLRSAKNKDQSAWAPPENTWEMLLAALSYLLRSAADRQTMLDPDSTEVDDNGPARVPRETAVLMGDALGNSDAERAKQRGWSQLHADSYGEILNVLEQRLSYMLSDGEHVHQSWQSAVMDWQKDIATPSGMQSGAQRLGAQKDFKALDIEALKTAASAFYPVYAVGYNWLQSNQKSGERLASEIERITKYYRDRKKICEKVIIVTHSMGGFVARSAVQEAGVQEKVLGVLHGVMPAIGAPAVYKRMRAGFEGVAQVVLGRNAAETTAVMANSPGGLELLPNAQYKTRGPDGAPRHWLRASSTPITQGGRQSGGQSTLLGDKDIYKEIYLNNSAWWRMVKEELINPAKINYASQKNFQINEDTPEKDNKKSEFEIYGQNIEDARNFHIRIQDKYHLITYAYYAADGERRSWNEVEWKCSEPVAGELSTAELVEDDLNGELKLQINEGRHKFEVQPGSGPGDGTVPAESGDAPRSYSVQIFKHEGKAKGHMSYDHQYSYNNQMTQAVTLYSIACIAGRSNWLQQNQCKA